MDIFWHCTMVIYSINQNTICPCFSRNISIETFLKYNSKYTCLQLAFPQQLFSLPNFYSYFFNSIATQKMFLFAKLFRELQFDHTTILPVTHFIPNEVRVGRSGEECFI